MHFGGCFVFQVYQTNNGLQVACNNKTLFENLTLQVDMNGFGETEYVPKEISCQGNCQVVAFGRKNMPENGIEIEKLQLIFQEINNTLIVEIELLTGIGSSCYYNYLLQSGNAVKLNFNFSDHSDFIIGMHNTNPFWDDVGFYSDFTELPKSTENLLYHVGEQHIHLMPLANNALTAHVNSNGVYITLSKNGEFCLRGSVFSVSVSNNPYMAIKQTYSTLKQLKLIFGEFKENKILPQAFKGLGWCTWNAFYHNVTAGGIFKKLAEMKEKNIQIQWLLIDDNWSVTTEDGMGGKLVSFEEDLTKFPGGLKNCIARIKSEYGVKYVGVWQAFTGYWRGIAKGGKVYNEYYGLLEELPDGRVFPGFTLEKAFGFWNTWHQYLAEQGVDFVKVDNQASFATKFFGIMQSGNGLKIQYDAIEKSIFKNFGGAVINCMGSVMENNLLRGKTAVNRSSDDFFPDKAGSFAHHCLQNAYAATFQQQLYYCDYDMFWSQHETAEVSAVLRAISGGPVYTSDEIEKTDFEILNRIAEKDGTIYWFEGSAVPTIDCFYQNCLDSKKPFKIYNFKGENYVLAAFNLNNDGVVCGSFALGDFLAKEEQYIVHDYFKNEFFIMNKCDRHDFEIKNQACALYSFYPVKNGKALIGNTRFYAEAATPKCRTITTEQIAELYKCP